VTFTSTLLNLIAVSTKPIYDNRMLDRMYSVEMYQWLADRVRFNNLVLIQGLGSDHMYMTFALV
jgi:hypothetical protein